MNDPVFVTGGTGFIGSHLVEELVKNGFFVKVLARKSSSTVFIDDQIRSGSVELLIGDLKDPDSFEGYLDGVQTVFHAAALSRDWGERKDFEDVNVKGTENLLCECKKAKIEHLIHISTCGVIGEEDQKEAKGESSRYRPVFPYFPGSVFPSGMNHYRETKMIAEKTSLEFCKMESIALTVARPVWVYGERELHSGPYILTKEASRGSRLIPGRSETLFHTIYVKDLARALVKLMKRKGDGNEIYMIGPEFPRSLGEYYGKFMDSIGSKGPIFIPKVLTYPVGFAMEALYTIMKRKHPPLLTRARVNMGFFNNVYNTSKYRKDFGGFEETPLQVGVGRSISWWKDNGYL